MSMNAKCIAAVRAAAGNRRISDGKINKIADKLDETMRQLAREDRALPPNSRVWASLTKDQQVAKGAERAMQEVQAAAALVEHNAALQVLRAAERDADMQKTMDRDKATVSQAAIMEMERAGMRAEAIKDKSLGGLVDMLDAVTAKDGAGIMRRIGMSIFDLDNPAMTRDVVREIFRNADGSTGNAVAKKGAAAWLKTIENARTRFNAAGGSVGKLSYGYLGHLWDSVAVGKVDADRFAKAMLGRVDRERYLRPDGSLMNDAEVTDLLKAAHETIKTEGDNKTLPGQFRGDGARANRGSDHRVIHFKDGDSWMEAMGEFGQGSLYDAMLGHVGRVSKDIALVEQFGPNPASWAKMQFDLAHRADGEGTVKNRGFGSTPEARWSILSGEASTPANETIAHTGNALRNLQVADKLGGAVISSLTDIATVLQTLHYDRLPMFDFARSTLGQTFSADQRRWLTTQGIVAESLANSINRFTGEHLTSSLSGRVASSVMKVSFMNAWTNGLRRAFSMTMMHGFEGKLGKTWHQLDEWDRFLMEKKGINEADWGVITQAQASEFGGRKYLTPESVRAVTDDQVGAARPGELDRISQEIASRTAELSARNAQEGQWIAGRIDAFDDARDSLNRAVKSRLAKRLAGNEAATGPLLERMALLDTQREAAKLQTDMEADFNRFVTQDEVRTFLNAVEDGASADKTAVGPGRKAVRAGLEAAETAGRRYGEAKGRLERRMVEIENRITAMDREALRTADAEGKAAAKKADAMRADLAAFVKRSQERQTNRQHVIDRMQAEEAPRLTAEAERLRTDAATKWHAFVSDEAQFAVVGPDQATRALTTWGGMQAGTINGEAARAFGQFKSFPIAMLSRHHRRIWQTPQGLEGAPAGFGAESAGGAAVNRLAVMTGLMLTSTLLGGLVLQTKAMLQGKDPYDMTEPRWWTRAMVQGGGLGYFGDLLFKDPTENRGGTAEQTVGVVAGPVAGTIAGAAWDLVVINAWEAAKGKETHAGAETLRLLSSNTPYGNLWQTRGLVEHWFLHNAQEAVNPGYLGRMQQRAMRDWGQGYWWAPGEAAPDRGPDLGRAFGQ